jgi:hypothetical protein
MNSHQRSGNSSPAIDQHSFGSPHVAVYSPNFQVGDLDNYGGVIDPQIDSQSFDSPPFLAFLDGNKSRTTNETHLGYAQQAAPRTFLPLPSEEPRQLNHAVFPSSPTSYTVFPAIDQQRYSIAGPDSSSPMNQTSFSPYHNRYGPLQQVSTSAIRNYNSPILPTHYRALGPPQRQSPAVNINSTPQYQPIAYPLHPDVSTNLYYTSAPYPARAQTPPTGLQLQATTYSPLEPDSGDNRAKKRQRGDDKMSPGPESSGTHGLSARKFASRVTKVTTKATKATMKATTKATTKAKESRTKRSLDHHSYAPFSGHFHTWADAQHELFGVKWTPPVTPEIPLDDAQKIPFVRQVYNAMTDFSEFYDKQGAKGDNRMLRQKAYDSRYIEARAWEVVVCLPNPIFLFSLCINVC